MEEKTSLITGLMVADAQVWNSLTLIDGLPDETSLAVHFVDLEPGPEKAELTESLEATDQGQLVTYTVRAVLGRESPAPPIFRNRRLLIYIETLNGEKYLLGSGEHPMQLTYTRPSGMTVADPNETSIQLQESFPTAK